MDIDFWRPHSTQYSILQAPHNMKCSESFTWVVQQVETSETQNQFLYTKGYIYHGC